MTFALNPAEKAKVPKWLWAKYQNLVRENERLQAAVDALSGKDDPARKASGIILYPTGSMDGTDAIYLSDKARIRFKIADVIGEYVDVTRPFYFADSHHDDLGIEIQASGRLASVPSASNVAVISTLEGAKRMLIRGGL
jgi:hypothetical protein